jgi:hypothetical protein
MKVIDKGLFKCNMCGREYVDNGVVFEKFKKYVGGGKLIGLLRK